jgi:hypothetical protein
MNMAFGVVRHCRKHSEQVFRAGVQLHHVIQKTDDAIGSRGTAGLFAKIISFIGLHKASPSAH